MYLKIKQATKEGYEKLYLPGVADFSYPNSKTRRGRVQGGGAICPTLTCNCDGIMYVEEDKE